jgi:hypothetical protein
MTEGGAYVLSPLRQDHELLPAKFEAFEPHAVGNVRGIKCVVPSSYVTIAWAAALRYRAHGDVPMDVASKGQLYIQARIFRSNQFTTHDKSISHVDWQVTEYFRCFQHGTAELLDDHAEKKNWQPRPGSGTCRISSKTRIELKLYNCPNATDPAFGTPKHDGSGNDLPNQSGKGSWKKTKEQSKGRSPPAGWGGKVWVAEYKMLTDHCDEWYIFEPDNPKIPTIDFKRKKPRRGTFTPPDIGRYGNLIQPPTHEDESRWVESDYDFDALDGDVER